MLRAGMFLQDRYEILEVIGSGGMSDVYKARCHKLNRLVAIKVLKEEFNNDANFVSKFKMEAQAAAGLSHPNIVNVFDVIDEGNIHYIVMELIEGITLKSYIQKKTRLEVKETVGIAIQVAHGIAAAHEQNIIHRDIKPQNMIISRDGKVKVADFGIARAATAQTLSSAAMGSVHYISPEQARGGYSDARSDIYSLGITIYEMVTGRLPFEGDNTVTIALAHLEEPITRPSIYNPDIPVSLENIILKCTEKKPERRYNNVPEVIGDLRKVLLSPNDNFVKMAPKLDNSETIAISARELEEIKKGQQSYKPSTRSASRTQPKASDNDINPKIEKLMTAVGVVVAILIVAILIFIFSRLSGIFNLGSGSSRPAETIPISTEETLDDTEVYMPDVMNIPQDMAEAKLKDSTLVMKVAGYEDSEEFEKGYVMKQIPDAGDVVSKYSSVEVIISNGSDMIDLAAMALSGVSSEAAKALLESKGLVVSLQEETNETIEPGRVARFSPEKAKEGETVTLYISLGPAAALKTVPSIANVAEEVGLEMLADVGLLPGERTEIHDDTVEAGTIISQGIASGTQLTEGSAIPYVVSLGKEPSSRRYIASISETYNLSNLIGPGAASSSIEVSIRLSQIVNGEEVTRELMKPRVITGQDLLPVNFPVIEGEPGVETGEVQIIDVATQAVIKTYPINFFAME